MDLFGFVLEAIAKIIDGFGDLIAVFFAIMYFIGILAIPIIWWNDKKGPNTDAHPLRWRK